MSVRFTFEPEKSLEALVDIVSKTGADLYRTLKIFYNADKMRLHKYGRFIAGDYYRAFQNGPAPQGAYDILHFVRGEHAHSSAPHAREALRAKEGFNFEPLREAQLDVLSQTDIECLDAAITKHGKKHWWQLRDESHDAAYNATTRNQEMPVEAIAAAAVAAQPGAADYSTFDFVPNAGQFRADVAFVAKTCTKQIFVLDDGRIVHALPIERIAAKFRPGVGCARSACGRQGRGAARRGRQPPAGHLAEDGRVGTNLGRAGIQLDRMTRGLARDRHGPADRQ